MLESANFARTRRKPHQFTLKKNNASNGSKSNACHHYEGVWPHEATPYSARGKDCWKCGKLNHFAKYCRSTKTSTEQETAFKPKREGHTVHNVTNLPSNDDEEYFYTVASEERRHQRHESEVTMFLLIWLLTSERQLTSWMSLTLLPCKNQPISNCSDPKQAILPMELQIISMCSENAKQLSNQRQNHSVNHSCC